jgi:hypothetical protein
MILFALPLLVLATAAPAGAASDRVDRTRWVDVDNDWVWAPGEACDFAVTGHSGGTLQVTSFYDRDGNLVRDVVTLADWKATFAANGKVLETPSPSVIHDTYHPDGSYTQAITGLTGHYVVPGEGLTWNFTGRLVLFFSGPLDQEPDVLVFTGGHPEGTFDQFAAMCRLLAP